jgi:hypothetical protein
VFQLTDKDQDKYKEFDMVVSAHWQDEICVTNVFDAVNEECAKVEAKKLAKMRRATPDDSRYYLGWFHLVYLVDVSALCPRSDI